MAQLASEIKIYQFENTSSTRLELQILLRAICQEVSPIKDKLKKVFIYTDSQNIVTLPNRRERLESVNFYSKKNKLLANHDLYREFYALIDKIEFTLIKVMGHKPNKEKNEIDQIFSLVDRAARSAHGT